LPATGGAFASTISDLVIETEFDSSVFVSQETKRLAFLWAAYKPEFWYFEIVETSRRMMLTAVLSVIVPGTSVQLVVAFCISVFYVKIYEYLSPYAEEYDNITANIGMFQIAATFFAAIIVSESLLSSDFAISFVDIALIAVNISVAFVSLYYTVKECRQDIGALEDVPTSDNGAANKIDGSNADGARGDGGGDDTPQHKVQVQIDRRLNTATRRASTAAISMQSTTDFYKAIKRHQSSRAMSVAPAPD
jgi:hypothetical protein